jgi:hypothetical protein
MGEYLDDVIDCSYGLAIISSNFDLDVSLYRDRVVEELIYL